MTKKGQQFSRSLERNHLELQRNDTFSVIIRCCQLPSTSKVTPPMDGWMLVSESGIQSVLRGVFLYAK